LIVILEQFYILMINLASAQNRSINTVLKLSST